MRNRSSFLVMMILAICSINCNLFTQDWCLDFDGTDDYVNLGSPSALDIIGQGSYTIEAWIKTSDTDVRQTVVGNYDGTPAYVLELHYTGNLRFYVNNMGYNSSTELDDGQWHHIAGVRDYNSDIRMYVDGIEIYNYGSDPEGLFTVANSTMIGRNPSAGFALNFDGLIDEVRIWDDVRSETEINNNMYNELVGNEQDLVAYYKFNENSGTNLPDESSNNNNGTLYNFALTGTTSNWVTSDPPLPVNLSSFYALYASGTPTLYWTTQSENNNAYWNVYRGTNDSFTTANILNANNPIPGNGTINSASDYVYVDNSSVIQNATYWYWIEDVSTDGETELHNPITLFIPYEDTPITPDTYGLQQNYPNPFNPSTAISFALAEESDVELIIYNIKGERVKSIFNDHIYADQIKTVIWDGNDVNGKQVSSGVYFYKLITNTREYRKKMLMVK